MGTAYPPVLDLRDSAFAGAGLLADRLGHGLALLDEDLNVLWCNEGSAGRANNPHGLICRQHEDCIDCPLQLALESGASSEFEIQRPDGVHMLRRLAAIRLSDGTILAQFADQPLAQPEPESEERYRELVDCMAEGLCFVDAGEFFVMANPAVEQAMGVHPGTLVGRNLREFIDENHMQRILAETGKRSQGLTSTYDVEVRRPDGARRNLQLTASPRFASNGKFLGSFTLLQDITERKEMEQALRDSQQTLQTLYDRSPVMMQSIDERGFIRNVNSRWLEAMGYEREEVIGRRIDEFLPAQIRQQVIREVIPRFWRTGSVENLQSQYVRQDGSVFDIEVNSVASRDAGGQRMSLAVIQDVTQRKRAQEQLKRLYTAIEQAGECIVVTGLDGSVQYLNSAFERLTGYGRGEALDELGHFTVPNMHDEALAAAAAVRVLGDEPWEGAVSCQRRDGSMLEVEAAISPVRDDGGALVSFVCSYRDVSRERSLQAQLVQAQKMEAVGQMAGGVAHEFNNLLTAIIGNLSLMELEGTADPNFEGYLHEACEASQRSADLTRQLLLFSRKTAGSFDAANIGSIAQAAAKLARHSFPPGLELALEIDPACAAVNGDANMIHQVVMNLVLNARDASPDGGVITVRTSPAQLAATTFEGIPQARAGKFVRLDISDTGSGMDAVTRARIFEPFFTTKPAGQGTGLGLAVVYSIIQQHNGWITVDSAPGTGTTFSVYIEATEGDAQPAPAPHKPARGSGETVLVVEDDAMVAQLLRETLRHHGYQVLAARNGDEALRLASEVELDLALIDITLPGINGIELWRQISANLNGSAPSVLFISGNSSGDELEAAVADSHFLAKPFRAEALLGAVEGALK